MLPVITPKSEVRRDHKQVSLHCLRDESRDNTKHVWVALGLKPRCNRDEDYHVRASLPHRLKPFKDDMDEGPGIALDD